MSSPQSVDHPSILALSSIFRVAFAFIFVIGISVVVPSARAQFDTAEVSGAVKDPHGAYVANAVVSLRNISLGTILTRKADAQGNYIFPDVQVGTYTVSVNAAGFAETITAPFDLNVGARQQVDVPLSIGNVNESITITINDVGLQKEGGEQSTTIDNEEIVDLPLNGRQYSDLAALTPGVQISNLQDGSVDERRSSINVNGSRSTANNFMLDGLDNNSYQEANQGFNNQAITESADAVEQYSVVTSNFTAEFGRSGGGIVNVKTKSGSNTLHGSLYEYGRNTALNAYGPFYGTGTKPGLVQNQFGMSMGYHLPKLKDFFFFFDYEGFRQSSLQLLSLTIPSADQRKGIFVAPHTSTDPTLIPVPLMNPITGTQYLNGIIPSSDITPFAAAVMAALPPPTTPGLGGVNYLATEEGANSRDIGDIRLDKYFGNRLQAFARFSKQSAHITNPPGIPGPAGGENGFGRIRILASAGTAGATYVLSPNSLMDLRFGVIANNTGKVPYNQGVTDFYKPFNIPFPNTGLQPAGLNTQSVDYFTSFGLNATGNQYNSPFTYNLKGSYTLAKHRHNFSFGYEWLHVNIALDPGYPLLGIDTYGGGFSYLNASTRPDVSNARRQAVALADFLFGARDTYSLGNYTTPTAYYDYHYGYAQDQWRAFPKLTLTYGIRYEFVTPERSHDQQIANFNPDTKALILSSPGSMYSESLVNPKLNDFAPRFGFAYSLYPNIVFRGGYGLSYTQFNRFGGGDDLLFNGPATVEASVTEAPPKAPTNPQPLCTPTSTALTTCYRSTMAGYPASLISPANFSTAITQTRYVPKNVVPGYTQSYSLGTQVQLAKGTVLNLAYVGGHGVHLRLQADYNESALQLPNQTLSTVARRPIQNFGTIFDNTGIGYLKYNSLQSSLTHRVTGGLFLLNSFTWSRAMDDSMAGDTAHGDSQYIFLGNPKYSEGISGLDQRLNESLSAVWKIPFGNAVRNRVLRGTARGWTLTTITRFTTGVPFNINYGPSDIDKTSTLAVYRPNYIGSLKTILNPRSKWIINNSPIAVPIVNGTTAQTCIGYCNVLNSSQLSVPVSAANGGTSPYGNLPRNAITGPWYENLDFGVQKNFPLPRKSNLQLRMEFFNVLNHTNFKAPNVTITSGGFGQYSGGSGSVYPSRQIQFAGRFTY